VEGVSNNLVDTLKEFFDIKNISNELSDFIIKGDYFDLGQGIGRLAVSLWPVTAILRAGGSAARATAQAAARMRDLAEANKAIPKLAERYAKQAEKYEKAASKMFDEKAAAQAKKLGEESGEALASDTTEALKSGKDSGEKNKKKKKNAGGGGGRGNDGVIIN
jgi:hypothetical protein